MGDRDSLKAHHWFIILLSKRAHDEYHVAAEAWEAKFGSHAEVLLNFWTDIGFAPVPFMVVGMVRKRAAWLERVMARIRPTIAVTNASTTNAITGDFTPF